MKSCVCFINPGVRKMGEWRGFSPGAAARHRSRTRVPLIFVRFLPVLFESVFFCPSFFPFFLDRTSFIVQSQIGGEYDFKTGIFGIVTPWRRRKLCPISKRVGEKKDNGMSDLKQNRKDEM